MTVSTEIAAQGKVLQVHPKDNVLVALTALKKGEAVIVSGKALALLDDVPAKHKFVTADLRTGERIVMYGISVGTAVEPLRQGSLITTQNVRHYAESVAGKSVRYEWTAPDVSRWQRRTFLGYHRTDGQVGTRNYWLVVPTGVL